MFRYYLPLMALLCCLPVGCQNRPPSAAERSIPHPPQPDGSALKICTERVPDYYTSTVDASVKAALPLFGKTAAQAEGVVESYVKQESGGTRSGKDLQDNLRHICQMANNGNWNEATTERLINRMVDKWDGGGVEAEIKKPKFEITFNGLSQEAIKAKFPIPLVLEPTQTAILTFVIANVGDGPALNSHASIYTVPDSVSVDRPESGEVHATKRNHNVFEIKGKPSLLTMKMVGASYTFKAEVKVPERIERFDLGFKIYADNLPYQELFLVFRPIHYKQPEAK